MNAMKKLLFIINEPTCFISHRLPIAIAAKEAGYEVHVATAAAKAPPVIHEQGFHYHPIPLSRSGKNSFVELGSLIAIYRLMKQLQPDLVHLVTIKPVLYGLLAARLARVPGAVAAVPGLGYVFTHHQKLSAKLLRRFIVGFYQQAFKHPNLKVIFQNETDQAILFNLGALKENQARLIHGSGVNLTQYTYYPEPTDAMLVVVMAARLLRDKGVIEYVQAAKQLRKQGYQARFCLAGEIDDGNPSAITKQQLRTWIDAKDIEYLGYCQDTALIFSKANVVVLPSYREGLPRVLAEAAACGRAIVTTDAPGCRDAIIPNQTGLLTEVKNVSSLVSAIACLLTNQPLREAMGKAGREFAERQFCITTIVKQHLAIYHEIHEQARNQ